MLAVGLEPTTSQSLSGGVTTLTTQPLIALSTRAQARRTILNLTMVIAIHGKEMLMVEVIV